VRAKSGQLNALVIEVQSLTRNLFSGYHRDFQLLKEPLFRAVDLCDELLEIMLFMLPQLQAEAVDLGASTYTGIYSVDEVTKRVNAGLSFREAYHELKNVTNYDLLQKPLETTHIGSLSKLGLTMIRKKINN
jgi:argininosuccinate lyase